MPELPEVESSVRYLRNRLPGRRIKSVQILWQRSIACPEPETFASQLRGAVINDVRRRGKFIVIQLSSRKAGDVYLLAHYRMSGWFNVVNAEKPAGKFDRVMLCLDNGKELRFSDIRKFGKMFLVSDPQQITGTLGIEPLEARFTVSFLMSALKKRRGAIKPLLLNQRIVAGLGNIYADESLWAAGIHPLTPAYRIPESKLRKFVLAARRILNRAIEAGGTDFGDGVVEQGRNITRVYGREGNACLKCREIIRKTTIGQRGTHFCPGCQKRVKK